MIEGEKVLFMFVEKNLFEIRKYIYIYLSYGLQSEKVNKKENRSLCSLRLPQPLRGALPLTQKLQFPFPFSAHFHRYS